MPAAKEGKWSGSTWTRIKNSARMSSTCFGARQGASVVLVEGEATSGRLDAVMVTKPTLRFVVGRVMTPRGLCVGL